MAELFFLCVDQTFECNVAKDENLPNRPDIYFIFILNKDENTSVFKVERDIYMHTWAIEAKVTCGSYFVGLNTSFSKRYCTVLLNYMYKNIN